MRFLEDAVRADGSMAMTINWQKLLRWPRPGGVTRLRLFTLGAADETDPAARLRRVSRIRVGLMLLMVAALSTVMSVHLRSDRVALRLGDVSESEIRAGRSVVYVNTTRMQRLQQAAMQATRPLYDMDEGAATNASRTVQQMFDRLAGERETLWQRNANRQKSLDKNRVDSAVTASQFATLLPHPLLARLLTVPPAAFQKLRDTTGRLVGEAEDREIRDSIPDTTASTGHPSDGLSGDLRHAQREIARAAVDALPAPGDADIVGAVAEQALRPNRLLNTRRTQEARERAARDVKPIPERIVLGDKILGRGDRVTADDVEKLAALGLVDVRQEAATVVAVCILASVMVMIVAVYIRRALPALYNDTQKLGMLALIAVLCVCGVKGGATLLGLSFSGGQLGYLSMMSVAAAGMLVAVLLDVHLAILVVTLLSVQSGILMNHEIRFTILTLLSSLVGIASVRGAREKPNLLQTALSLAAANLGLVWLLGLLFKDTTDELIKASAWTIAAALLATFLYWFGLLSLEKPFGLLTHTTLLEMSAFDRPLLQQLCAIAPGTYAHSMMVGTLAEAGAQAIGADALLCRVGGYYHDIGKINRPDFFVENQRNENIHARLSPSLSALFITAHVRDGLEMARQHRLPNPIRDIIGQHHGTTLIRYFYHRALSDHAEGEPPATLEERFRYPGPRPQTREAAIVMLADSIEAAVRCLDKPSQERLETRIAEIVREKIEDHQFDDCALTFRDIRLISAAFLHVLKAMLHGRIDYPREAPRTATGRPMEVSRADLRPESTLAAPLSLMPGTEYPPSETPAAEAVPAPNGDPMPAEYAHPLPAGLVEPEVLYERSHSEHPDPAPENRSAAAGDPPPAPGRRGRLGRHKRSPDR